MLKRFCVLVVISLGFSPAYSFSSDKCLPNQSCWRESEAIKVHAACVKSLADYLSGIGFSYKIDSYYDSGFNQRTELSDGRISYVGGSVSTSSNLDFYNNRKPRGSGNIWVSGGMGYIAKDYVIMCSFPERGFNSSSIDVMVVPRRK